MCSPGSHRKGYRAGGTAVEISRHLCRNYPSWQLKCTSIYWAWFQLLIDLQIPVTTPPGFSHGCSSTNLHALLLIEELALHKHPSQTESPGADFQLQDQQWGWGGLHPSHGVVSCRRCHSLQGITFLHHSKKTRLLLG